MLSFCSSRIPLHTLVLWSVSKSFLLFNIYLKIYAGIEHGSQHIMMDSFTPHNKFSEEGTVTAPSCTVEKQIEKG
jgi:hypothetical protein